MKNSQVPVLDAELLKAAFDSIVAKGEIVERTVYDYRNARYLTCYVAKGEKAKLVDAEKGMTDTAHYLLNTEIFRKLPDYKIMKGEWQVVGHDSEGNRIVEYEDADGVKRTTNLGNLAYKIMTREEYDELVVTDKK
jgi:hypothetical protein